MRLGQLSFACAALDRSVTSRRHEFCKAIITGNEKAIEIVHVVRGKAGRCGTTWEAKLKLYGLVNTFFELNRICFCLLCRYPNWLFTKHVARPVDCIDTNVHEGATTRKLLV